MNEAQILKEIAYYSRVIDKYKKQNQYSSVPQSTNKYIYVKQKETIVLPPVNNVSNTSNKVLINPNFKQSVHINPHFNAANNRKIHVNPKILNVQLPIIENELLPSTNTVPTASNLIENIKPVAINLKQTPKKRRLSIRSKYKIVKSSNINPTNAENSNKVISHLNSSGAAGTRKRRISIRTKYKIVKRSNSIKSPTINSRYKIDRRSINICNRSLKKKVIKHGISDILRNKLFKNVTWKRARVINQFKLNNNNNTRLTNISGILYKKSQTKLQKVQNKNNSFLKQKRNVISVKGQKYVMSTNKKALKLVSNMEKSPFKTISVKGITYKKTSPNKFIRINSSSESLKKVKFKNSKLQTNKLRKNNQPCPVYRRFGKCRRKELGRCNFLHNPDQIFLCKKFLQGACVDDNCLLSHKVSLEKMPTCKYFLEGCCVRTECSYLHVKINPKAGICKKFLEGYCEKGSQCNLRHQFLCPNFERDGKCPRRRCLYPHKNKNEKESNTNVPNKNQEIRMTEEPPAIVTETARYYKDVKTSDDNDVEIAKVSPGVSVDINDADSDHNNHLIFKRPQLGALPSFIPF